MKLTVLAVLALVALGLAAPAAGQRAPGYGGTLVIGGSNDLQMMNSLVNAEGYTTEFLNHVLFMPLLKLDRQLQLVPALARSWQNSGDSLFVFRLRRDVRWHDGKPTTAHDVAFTFRRALDTLTAYPNIEAIEHIRSVEAVDSYTVRMRAEPRHEPLLGLIDVAIMPRHLLDSIPSERMRQAAFNKKPVGNGPYRFMSQRANDRWVFEANRDFPRELGGRPFIDRVIWRVVPDNTAQLTALRNAEIDMAVAIRAEQLKQLDATAGVRGIVKPSQRYAMITWNGKKPPLNQAAVRRALTMGINRQQIINVLRGGYGSVAASPVPPTHWAFDPGVTPLPYDTTAARRLLAQAGYSDRDRNGILESADGKPLELELKVASNNQFNRDVGEMVRADLARIGVRVVVRPVEFATMVQDISGEEKRFDGAFLIFQSDMRLEFSDAFHTNALGGPFQSASYSNSQLDALLDRVKTARTQEQARPVWAQIQRILRDEQPWTFLWYQPELFALRERVRDTRLDIRGVFVELPRWWLADHAQRN